jgi:anti-sigma B factor antagonist
MESTSNILVSLPERFTAKEARRLTREFEGQVSKEHSSVVVDLSKVRDMDRAGLDSLVQCMADVVEHDGAIQLAGVSPEAATILELTQLDRIFSMFPRYEEERLPEFSYELVRSEINSQVHAGERQPVAA